MERNAGRFSGIATQDLSSSPPNARIRVVCSVRGDPLYGCWYPQDAPHDPRAYSQNVNRWRYT
jgi:hypothetical protein